MTDLRRTLLEIVEERERQGTLQAAGIMQDLRTKLGSGAAPDMQRAALVTWNDLFRTGLLAWGSDLSNPSPPFFHITATGRRTLQNLSRDPYNPEGYFAALSGIEKYPIAASYVREAVSAFVMGLPRAAAVLVGAATEDLILNIRDELVTRIRTKGTPPEEVGGLAREDGTRRS